jgi:serine/threonine protein phosphatase PrpC
VNAGLDLAVGCNVGRKHPKNEDSGTVIRGDNGSIIMVVSDGVSSAVNAVSASQQAIAKVKEVLSKGSGNDAELTRAAINQANEVIMSLPYETRDDGIYGPEATIVTAIVSGDTATIGWVGDSRAYVLSRTSQELITTDDSWMELVAASGEMTRREAAMDKRAHYVTQVLGMHDQEIEIHILQRKLEKDQMLLLCTDGLWNYFQDDDELLRSVNDFGMEKDAADICEYLIGLANTAGGHDNITVAIFKNF